MPEVRCSVSNCSFWGQGNFCQANTILVQPDSQESIQSEDESFTDTILSGQAIESSTTTSVETCCHTFQPRY
ncbi:DUF1540 domain-containing protein [Bacillus rhizoplanae]|uniref:DUF1540 domain-containing protein n=1 Tax=Bacillus rhizoplanae TaxID=2880966 RepID=UPI003D257529